MKKFTKFLAPLLAMLLLITALPLTAAAATLDGNDSFTKRDLSISADNGASAYEWKALVPDGTRTPYPNIGGVLDSQGYSLEYVDVGRYVWSSVRQDHIWIGAGTYVLRKGNWNDSVNIRGNLENRDLTLRQITLYDLDRDTFVYFNAYEVKNLSYGGGFFPEIYALPSVLPGKITEITRVSGTYWSFNLTTVNSNTGTVRHRYDLLASIDGSAWKTWRANEFTRDTTLNVDARDMARALGYAIEFRKAGQWYTDPATGKDQWLDYDTYIILSETNWNNSKSSMRTDIRDLNTLTRRDVLIWQPYQGSWAWRTVNEVGNTKDGGGFMFNIMNLADFFPGVSRVEQSTNNTSRFYITTKDISVIDPPYTPPAPQIPSQPDAPPPAAVDPNDIHGPKPPAVTDFIPATK